MTDAASDGAAAPDSTIPRYAWVAAVLGFLAPGLGHLYMGRLKLIGYVMTIWALVASLFYTELPTTFVGFALLLSGFVLIQLFSTVHAGAVAWRNPIIRRERFHRWYVYAAYAIGFTAVVAVINAGTFDAVGVPSIFGRYKPFRVTGSSMEPGMQPGEYFVVKLAQGSPQADWVRDLGEIVVVSWPEEQGQFVYRLAAVGGQKIAIRGREVVVDGKALARKELCSFSPEIGDPDVARSVETHGSRTYVVEHIGDGGRLSDSEEQTVPAGSLFVLGDSRDNANDSRFRSATAAENFSGRVLFILWSSDWTRIGRSLTGDAPIVRDEYCPPGAK